MRASMRIALVLAAVALWSCAGRRLNRGDLGIPRCPATAAADLLSIDALQCWFDAPHGRWRVLLVESHLDVLVVQTEARDIRDANEIARRFVAGEGQKFSEILVYAQPESAAQGTRMRR